MPRRSALSFVDALPLLQKIALQKKHSKAIYKAAAIWYTFIDAISSRSFYEKVQQPVCGGGKKNRVKFVSLILATSLALSCTFFSCANASGGGSDNPGGNGDLTTGENDPQSLSSARWSCTTSEEETAIGNKVSEVLCLFDDNKFELRKNISYEDISFYQTFYKGTYEGGIREGMTFAIEEELDTADFDDEMNQVFNLESADAKNARSVMATTRAVSLSDIAAILDACRAKLKDAKFKKVTDKSMSLETKNDSVVLTDADGNENDVVENAVDGCINLDGFLLTGNPCNRRLDKDKDDWAWANTEEEGARVLEKTKDGKWTCQFRADSDDTLIRIIWNNWMADWGLSSIDKENSTLPSGVGITDDTQAVNNTSENKKWQDPRNIAITGLEAKRKYDITFDTKKSPGKICIELAEHKISTLDGWLFTASSTGWTGTTAGGDLSLKKNGDTWQVSFTANEGWNGFKLCTQNWLDEIGWSSFDWENAWKVYNGLRGSNVEKYSLEDDDAVAYQGWDFDGTEKITLTFGINNGRVTCKTDIEYTKEFDLDLYTEYSILETEPHEENSWNILASGEIGSDKSFSFYIKEVSSGILLIEYPTGENGSQLADCQRLESVDLPNGVNWALHDYLWGILLTGLVPDKTYNVQLKQGSKTGYFKIIITE
ncbi:MAG: hypothetical protein K2F89_00125 [Treponemataceae bacterium]|nr:hypothetical protein [Treponemataceae bacterium]